MKLGTFFIAFAAAQTEAPETTTTAVDYADGLDDGFLLARKRDPRCDLLTCDVNARCAKGKGGAEPYCRCKRGFKVTFLSPTHNISTNLS